jgi:hypothetical protein
MTDSNKPSLKLFGTFKQDTLAVKAQGHEREEVVIRAQKAIRGSCSGLNQRITEVKPW